MNVTSHSRGHLLAFFTVLIWGTTFVSTKVLLQSFTPYEIVLFRFVLGYLALWALYPKPLRLQHKKQEWYFVAAGLCGMTLYYLFENVALSNSPASTVGVIVSIAPFFTAVFAHFFLKDEQLRPSFFIGFICAIVGIVFISWNGGVAFHIQPIGVLLSVLSAMVWGIYAVLGRKISAFGYHTIQTTRRTFFYGIVFIIPVLMKLGMHLDIRPFLQPVNILNVLYLSLGASAVCFVTWNIAVATIGATKTSAYIYITPVISVLSSALILHEALTVFTILGTALTLIGLILSEYRTPDAMQTRSVQ